MIATTLSQSSSNYKKSVYTCFYVYIYGSFINLACASTLLTDLNEKVSWRKSALDAFHTQTNQMLTSKYLET